MAYNDFLNKDPMVGGVMDAPDLQVRIAQAKIAANAAHLLTAKEWKRLAIRQELEQQSAATAQSAAQKQQMFQGGPIDVNSYTGSMWAAQGSPMAARPIEGYQTREQTADRILKQRFGEFAPGQIRVAPSGSAIQQVPPEMMVPAQPQVTDEYLSKAADYIAASNSGVGKQAVPSMIARQQTPVQAGSVFEQELKKPVVPMQTGMKTLNELLPSLGGNAQVRSNEAIADAMRGAGYAVKNFLSTSSWVAGSPAGRWESAVYSPESNPKYIEQLRSRLDAFTDKSAPAAVAIQNELNKLSSPTPSNVVPTDTLYRAFGVTRKTPAQNALQLLSNQPVPKQTSGEIKINVPQIPENLSGMNVEAQQPEEQPIQQAPSIGQIPQFGGQPSVAAPSQFPTYKTEPFTVQPFDPRQLMAQPSVSETLGMKPALAAYQASTKAQLAAYKATQAERKEEYRSQIDKYKADREMIRDDLDRQVKGVQMEKNKAETLATQIANSFAMGGPQFGTFEVGGQEKGFLRTGPKSIHVIDLKPNQTNAERVADFRLEANKKVASFIKSGDIESAAITWQSIGGKPEDFELFKNTIESVQKQPETKTEAKQAPAKQTQAQPTKVQQIRNPKTGEVKELRNGVWVTVK